MQLTLAVVLLVSLSTHAFDHVHAQLIDLQDHVSSAWSQRFVSLLTTTLTPRRLHLAAAALVVDGVLTAIEGYALHTRKIWGEWLVVVATGGLIPIEAYELVRHVRPVRALVLALNIAVVVYLARRRYSHGRISSGPCKA